MTAVAFLSREGGLFRNPTSRSGRENRLVALLMSQQLPVDGYRTQVVQPSSLLQAMQQESAVVLVSSINTLPPFWSELAYTTEQLAGAGGGTGSSPAGTSERT